MNSVVDKPKGAHSTSLPSQLPKAYLEHRRVRGGRLDLYLTRLLHSYTAHQCPLLVDQSVPEGDGSVGAGGFQPWKARRTRIKEGASKGLQVPSSVLAFSCPRFPESLASGPWFRLLWMLFLGSFCSVLEQFPGWMQLQSYDGECFSEEFSSQFQNWFKSIPEF